MKIYKDKFYVYSPTAVAIACYGKVLPTTGPDFILWGSAYSRCTSYCRVGFIREFTGDDNLYRIQDGRLQEFQTRVTGRELVEYMRKWTYHTAIPVHPMLGTPD
jgi:hypothetical protein